MSFFTVPLAEAVRAALIDDAVCGGRIYSYVPPKLVKPYVLIEDFSGRTERLRGLDVVNEQFSIKVFDGAETLENSLNIRQQITEILIDETFEVAGAGLVLLSVILELAGFNQDGEDHETMARFNALLHKE
ncbi:MAG: hypothetical protein COB24_08845 [Hyphomicrobiales bacterium]|nr:MAG: hypothetical protein COB24_08845 [Hyphomicrobiales bacterium]